MSNGIVSFEVGKRASVARFMVAPRFAIALNGVFPSTPNLDLIPMLNTPSNFVLDHLHGSLSIIV